MAESVKITQVRSSNRASRSQLATLASLRLGRIGRSSTMTDNAQLRGALAKVAHLVEVSGGDGGGS